MRNIEEQLTQRERELYDGISKLFLAVMAIIVFALTFVPQEEKVAEIEKPQIIQLVEANDGYWEVYGLPLSPQ